MTAPRTLIGENEIIADLRAEIARLTAERDAFRRNLRDTFDAMCAMRNSINEYLPMPSIESDLLQGPENSIFCAAVAEAVVSTLTVVLAERDAALAGRVKVKPLVWVLEPDRDAEYPRWTAETDTGKSYHAFKAWWGAQDKWAFMGTDGFHHSEVAAKAAAQADYEARIIAALEPQPITVQDAARVLLDAHTVQTMIAAGKALDLVATLRTIAEQEGR